MKTLNLLQCCLLLTIFLSAVLQSQAQNGDALSEQLVRGLHEAETNRNADKLSSLLTNDFVQTRINPDGSGQKKYKKGILILSESLCSESSVEFYKEAQPVVTATKEVTDFSVQISGDKSTFKYKLTERCSLKIPQIPAIELSKIERFDTVGTAVLQNGKWLISSLQKTFKPSEKSEQKRKELIDSTKFEAALFIVAYEAAVKKGLPINKQESNKEANFWLLLYESSNLALNPKVEISEKFKNALALENTSPELQSAPEWVKRLAAKTELLRTNADASGISTKAFITSHQYRGQTVYQLNFISRVLYNRDGEVLCIISGVDEESLDKNSTYFDAEYAAKTFAERCPGFDAVKNDGKLIWQGQSQKNVNK